MMLINFTRLTRINRLAALALLMLSFVQLPVGAWTEPNGDPMPSRAYDHRDGPSLCNLPPTGFVPGQTLRVTLAHVAGQVEQDQGPPDLRVGVWVLDAEGSVIAQSAQVQVPSNEFRSFSFNRAALNLSGEPGTGRLQVRACLVMHVADPYRFSDDPRATGLLMPSVEVIDNSTGETKSTYTLRGTLTLIAD